MVGLKRAFRCPSPTHTRSNRLNRLTQPTPDTTHRRHAHTASKHAAMGQPDKDLPAATTPSNPPTTSANANDASVESFRRALSGTSTRTKRKTTTPTSAASLCLAVAHQAGLLAEVLQWQGEIEGAAIAQDAAMSGKVLAAASGVALSLVALAEFCHVDLGQACLSKIALNARKYPAAMVKGQAHKYDHYSQHTGIGKLNQTLAKAAIFRPPPWDTQVTLGGLRAQLRQFVAERDWAKYHSPRNLLLAMVGELGELGEAVQAVGNGRVGGWPQAAKDELAQEIADVFIYLVRFSDVAQVDLAVGVVQALAQKQAEGQGEEDEEEDGFSLAGLTPSVGWMVSGVAAAACVGAALLQKKR